MGLFSKLFGGISKDYSDGVICPVCGSKCYWDGDEWVCDSCGYVPDADTLEYDSETDTVNALDIDWYCDECDAYLNSQRGFNPYADTWVCKKCGYENDLSEDNILD